MTRKEELKDILNNGIIEEIYKAEEALHIYNTIADNAAKINERTFGIFFSAIQRNLLDSVFLSIAKIYENTTKTRSIPNIRRILTDNKTQITIEQYIHLKDELKEYFDYTLKSTEMDNDLLCKELANFIKDNNPFKDYLAIGIKDSRDKLIAHSQMNVNREELQGIKWKDIDILLTFAKKLSLILSFAYFTTDHSTNEKASSTCLIKILKELEVIIE